MQRTGFDEEKARTCFSPAAWDGGEAYVVNGAITPLTVQHTQNGVQIVANVRRSADRSYRVTLECTEAGVCRWQCTCPFEAGGGCAHCAAVVIWWCRRSDPLDVQPVASHTVPVTAQPAPDDTSVERPMLWLAADGTICVDVAHTGERAMRVQDILGDYLVPGQEHEVVSLSALGFANALQQGVTADQMLAALAVLLDGPLPADITAQVSRWIAAADNLHLYDSLCIIEFADDFILQELLRVSGLRHYLVHIFSPRVIAVQPKQVEALVADLESRGYMPRVEAGY